MTFCAARPPTSCSQAEDGNLVGGERAVLLQAPEPFERRRCKGSAIERKRRQILSILSLVDVNALFALCVDVEACLEKLQTVWVRPLWFVGPW